MRRTYLFSALALLLAASAVHADTLRTFQLNLKDASIYRFGGVEVGQEILDGSVTVNVTTGDVVSAMVFDDAGPFDFYADSITSKGYIDPPSPPKGGGGGGSTAFLASVPIAYGVNLSDSKTSSTFDLILNTTSLVDYNGGTICSAGCKVTGSVYTKFAGNVIPVGASGTTQNGTATLYSSTGDPSTPPSSGSGGSATSGTAVTPEPTTLCLVGSGLLGVAAQLGRRKQAAGAA